jgi:hypothetical protein
MSARASDFEGSDTVTEEVAGVVVPDPGLVYVGAMFHDLDPAEIQAVTAAHPRPDFKRRILAAFTEGSRTARRRRSTR